MHRRQTDASVRPLVRLAHGTIAIVVGGLVGLLGPTVFVRAVGTFVLGLGFYLLAFA